ncbi:hypothetical protein AB4653_27875, partial [Vibrio sp. 10N.222.48.A3]
MEILDVSWTAITKLILSGIGLYIIAPILLTLRDLLITKLIERFLLSQTIRDSIHMCEADRWLIDHKYNEPVIMDRGQHYIGKKKVTEKQYENYKRCMWKHHKRFGLLDSKIQFRENIINYVMNH